MPLSASSRPDLTLSLSLALASLAGGLFLPLSLVYFTVLTDIALPVLGAIVSASVLVGLPLPLLAGVLVDRVGARPVVILGLVCQVAAYSAFVVARGPVAVFAASTVMVVGTRLFWSSVFSLLADYAEAGSTLSTEGWFGRLNAARTVGIVGGGLITGVVISLDLTAAYVALAWAAAASTAVAAVLITGVRVRHSPSTEGGAVLAGLAVMGRDRAFVVLLLVNSVFALCIVFVGLSLPTVVRSGLQGPGWLTSALLVVNALLVAMFSARGAAAARTHSQVSVLTRAGALWCGAFALVAVATSLGLVAAAVLLLVAMALLSAAEVLHAPSSAALVNTLAGSARGRYLAVFQYSFVLAELVGPILFTGLFRAAPALPFAVVSAAGAAAALVLARCGATPEPSTRAVRCRRGRSP
ncbi:MFS transporter [Cellulomonas fengjieae]|uniref:Major facilitator superfamily (MFS) profile domain-containing protein n=1 Tax=Cellulomonas fengjieae TaxID=2819978 RepID=A0ABS3SKJ8_9CELL|nr:MFS transporter [Cellulomonas fengjieae]MBO3086273.1 hypothetical protein [Cellulomonas fengjieae]QVI65684.1 hypothetical protein KG102_16590 [Cellulomonas fengjieae]